MHICFLVCSDNDDSSSWLAGLAKFKVGGPCGSGMDIADSRIFGQCDPQLVLAAVDVLRSGGQSSPA